MYHMSDGMTGEPPFFILDFQRGSDKDSLCKVSWNSYSGVYFESI